MGSEIVIDGMKFEELSSDFGDDKEFANRLFKELDSGSQEEAVSLIMYIVDVIVEDSGVEAFSDAGSWVYEFSAMMKKKLLESTETGGKVKRLSRLFYLIRDKILSDAGLEEGLRND